MTLLLANSSWRFPWPSLPMPSAPGTGTSLEVKDQLQSDKHLSWTRPWKGIIQVKANYINETKAESHSCRIRSMSVSSHPVSVHKSLCNHWFPICIWFVWDIQLSCYHVYVARLTTSGAHAAEAYRSRVEKRTTRTQKGGGRGRSPFQSQRFLGGGTELTGGNL